MRFTTVLLCFAGVLTAQQSPVIQTETREVLVDAIVTTKNGAYVRDLSAKDFRSRKTARSKPSRASRWNRHPPARRRAPWSCFSMKPAWRRGIRLPVRQAAASFIDAEAGPNHRMAIVTFNGSMRIAQSFTDNAGRLKDALNQASFHGLAPSAADSDRSHDPSVIEEDRVVGHASGTALASAMGARNMIRVRR